MDRRRERGPLHPEIRRVAGLSPEAAGGYCADVFFFIGQAADEEGQQQGLSPPHFLAITGHFVVWALLEAHPVNPMVAMLAAARRVRRVFIRLQM